MATTSRNVTRCSLAVLLLAAAGCGPGDHPVGDVPDMATHSCPQGQTDCHGASVDLQSDNNNCGACGTACGQHESCLHGTCTLTCAQGLTACHGACVDLQSDNNNCGACGTACGQHETCVHG